MREAERVRPRMSRRTLKRSWLSSFMRSVMSCVEYVFEEHSLFRMSVVLRQCVKRSLRRSMSATRSASRSGRSGR